MEIICGNAVGGCTGAGDIVNSKAHHDSDDFSLHDFRKYSNGILQYDHLEVSIEVSGRCGRWPDDADELSWLLINRGHLWPSIGKY